MKISKILLGAAMFIAAPVVKGGCQMMAQNAPQEPIVVDTPFVHDPVMAYENGKYYLYCTGHGITQMTSTDRKHWTIVPQGVLKNSEIPHGRMIVCRVLPRISGLRMSSDSRTSGIWLIPVLPLARTHLPSAC